MGKWSEAFKVEVEPLSESEKSVWVRLCLFRGVGNPGELKSAAEAGEIDAALLKASLILETFQVLAAATRALNADARDRLVTRSLSTELIYSLSPTKNISESLATFSIATDSEDVLAVTFNDEKGRKMAKLAKRVNGSPASLGQLSQVASYADVKRVYHVREPELNKGSIMDAIVSRIVTKDYVS